MTKAQIRKYLEALPAPEGQAKPNLDAILDVAIEAGFKWFWGSNDWTFKRAEDSFTTTASQAYDALPADFEQAIGLRCEVANRSLAINLLSENRFDMEHPYPAGKLNGRPTDAKIVRAESYKSGNQKPWRVYWARVPDGTYTMILTYTRSGGSGLLGSLPSYAVHGALLCMRYHAGLSHYQEAQAGLTDAIQADGEIVGTAARIGNSEDQDAWDAFSGGGHRGGTFLD